MRHLDISYQVKGQASFLVLEEQEGEQVIPYCVRMMENNRIPGLLPMFSQVIDEQEKFNYEITGKMKLSHMVQNTKLTAENGKKLLFNLADAMLNLEEYFLNISGCVLSEEYVFVDTQYHVFLVYNPVASQGQDKSQEIKNFFLEIIGLFSSKPELKEQFNECLHFLIRPDFSLKAFRESLEPSGDREISAQPTKPLQAAQPLQPAQTVKRKPVQEAPVEEVKKDKAGFGRFLEEKKANRQDKAVRQETTPLFGGDIPVPGFKAASQAAPETKSKGRQKQEKKSFSLFGKKKTSKVELDLEDHVIPADQPREEKQQQASPAYQPQSWSGTVMEDEGGGTVMEGELENGGTPCLIYQGKTYPLLKLPFSIGKQNCSLSMIKPTVSRRHATITLEQGEYCIVDENSTNKTYVNGQMIPPYSPVPLSDGDQIACSSEEIIFKKG